MPVSESTVQMKYIAKSIVTDVYQKFSKTWVSGMGDSAVFAEQSKGWFLQLADSNDVICMGDEQPQLKKGDKVRIIIERE